MDKTKRPVNVHENYHAHVYCEASNSEAASRLCAEIGARFGLKVGRFHEKPVGPHPCWSCQIAFSSGDFDQLIPWLEENSGELTVLVHGLSAQW